MALATHVSALAGAADPRTAAHARCVADLASAVAEEMGLAGEALREVELAALLHDVGKTAIPSEILHKPEALTPAERAIMESHVIEGQTMLMHAEDSLYGIAQIVRSSHERFDGTGYPDGLAGHEIPLAARIVFCCDSYDAITSDRPYRRATSQARAMGELWGGAGNQFDPIVVAATARALYARRRAGDEQRLAEADRLREVTAPAQIASARAIS